MARKDELWILIKAHDEATKKIQSAVKDLKRVIESARSDAVRLERSFYGVGGAIEKANMVLEKFGIEAKKAKGVFSELASVAQSVAVGVGTWEVMNKFQDLVTYSIDYQKTIEDARLGLASILSSVADIRTETGKLLEGQEKFNVSLKLSQGIIKRLQRENLKTVATFDELLEAFQAIMGPGLAAGLNVDQLVELTTVGVNAVKALNLDGRQVVQELRDLIQGGGAIQPGSSTLATVLNISGPDIERWKKAGTLFQELMKRLQGFQYAANELQNTFSGLLSNVKDALGMLLQEGTSPIFEGLKETLNEVLDKIVVIKRDAKGHIIDIKVNPQAVEALREISEEIKKVGSFASSVGQAVWAHRQLLGEVLKLVIAYKSLKWAVGAFRGALLALRFNPWVAGATALAYAFNFLSDRINFSTLTLKKASDEIPLYTEKIKKAISEFREELWRLNKEQMKAKKLELQSTLADIERKIKELQGSMSGIKFPKPPKGELPVQELKLKPAQGSKYRFDFKALSLKQSAFTQAQRELLKKQKELRKLQEQADLIRKELDELNKIWEMKGYNVNVGGKTQVDESVLSQLSGLQTLLNKKLRIRETLLSVQQEQVKTAVQLAREQVERLKKLGVISSEDYFKTLKALVDWETDKEIELRKKTFEKRKKTYLKLLAQYEAALGKAKKEEEKEKIRKQIEDVRLTIKQEEASLQADIKRLEGQRKVKLFEIDSQSLEENKRKFETLQTLLSQASMQVSSIQAEISKKATELKPLDPFAKKYADIDKWTVQTINKIEKLRQKLLKEKKNSPQIAALLSQLDQLRNKALNVSAALRGLVTQEENEAKQPLAGARKAIKEFAEETKLTGKYVHDLVKQTLYQIENVFANNALGLLEGRALKLKKIFQDLSKTILQTLIQIGIRKTITPKFEAFWEAVAGKKASGGLIVGGIPNKDSVPILAMPGEFVINKAAVEHYGLAFIEAINRMRLPRYASGGPVGIPSRPAPSQSASQTVIVQNSFHVADPISFEKYVRKTGIDRLIAQRVREQLEFGG